MRTGKGEAAETPPRSTEYKGRLDTSIIEMTTEIKGFTAAIEDAQGDKVKSIADLHTLIEVAKEQLAEPYKDEVKQFLFCYIDQLERIVARIIGTKYKGNNYNA